MISDNVRLCNGLLAEDRRLAAIAGVPIGKLTTYSFKIAATRYYTVYEDGREVWNGAATCAADAKHKYLAGVLDFESETFEETVEPDDGPEVF